LFSYERFGSVEVFSCVEVARTPDEFYLCQRKYALNIISEVGLLGVKPANVLMEQNHRLTLFASILLVDP